MLVYVMQTNHTCAHIQDVVHTCVQALAGMDGHVCVVCRPAEQKGLSGWREDLPGHQRVPPDKVQDVVRQGGGRVQAPRPLGIGYTLHGHQDSQAKASKWRLCDYSWTKPGLCEVNIQAGVSARRPPD